MKCLNFDDCEDTRKGHCLGDREDLDCFVKPDQNPQAGREAGSAEFDLLDTPPVQAIKDAMWFVDQILNDYDFNKRQHGLAKKCLRELHQYLDRLGV